MKITSFSILSILAAANGFAPAQQLGQRSMALRMSEIKTGSVKWWLFVVLFLPWIAICNRMGSCMRFVPVKVTEKPKHLTSSSNILIQVWHGQRIWIHCPRRWKQRCLCPSNCNQSWRVQEFSWGWNRRVQGRNGQQWQVKSCWCDRTGRKWCAGCSLQPNWWIRRMVKSTLVPYRDRLLIWC